jgi:hypothetical protein
LPEFCVWPENALALILWLSLQTQWVYAADGQRVGLHYPSVWLVLEKHPKVREKEKWNTFLLLTAMESEVLRYLRDNKPTT